MIMFIGEREHSEQTHSGTRKRPESLLVVDNFNTDKFRDCSEILIKTL